MAKNAAPLTTGETLVIPETGETPVLPSEAGETPAPKPDAASVKEGLGGAMVPLPSAITAAARPRPISMLTPPGQSGTAPATEGQDQRIRRIGTVAPRIAGMPTSATATPETPASPVALPAFLGGLTESQRNARRSCELLAAQLGVTLGNLRNDAATVGSLIAAIDANPDGASMAEGERMDLARIKKLHTDMLTLLSE